MKILVADDDPSSLMMLERVLTEWGYEVTTAVDGEQAWHLLQQPDAPTLAILDWIMPNLVGPEICRRLRQKETGRYTYIILLTVLDEKEDRVHGIDAGADDYITKPFDPQELKVRVNSARRQLQVHERLIVAQDTIRKEAMRDPLTGIPNRAAIVETVQREAERSLREKTPLALAMADLDNLKAINDAHGHSVGDEALVQVVRTFQALLRSYDAIGRYGGDEFLIVLPGLSTIQAVGLCERLRAGIADRSTRWSARKIALSISVGVVATDGSSPAEAGDLLQGADDALYVAKRAGRNRVQLYEAAPPLFKSA